MMKLNDAIIYYYPDGHEHHYEPGHPERPERVEALRDSLMKAGWWDTYPLVQPISLTSTVLNNIHNPRYLEMLKRLVSSGQRLDGDTYTTKNSWDVAYNTAGGAAAVAQAVWNRRARTGFALCRPPGHHATRDWGMGFCLLNNIALAAENLIQNEHTNKLAIIDLDLHHGNGTQDIFWDREDVLYISTHQSPWYPGTGSLNEIGAGAGTGTTVNIPLPPGSGDEAFTSVMNSILLPIIDRFQPQMLLISFGFDPHWRDPLGYLQLSARGYYGLIAALAEWAVNCCEGRIALFLEGGYDLDAAAACGQAVTAALLGIDWDDPLGPSPTPEDTSWRIIVENARKMWNL